MKRKLATLNNEQVMYDFLVKIEQEREHYESYIETITAYCDENLIEYEDIVSLISIPLLKKIKEEEYPEQTGFY